jgi:hypothetical protein
MSESSSSGVAGIVSRVFRAIHMPRRRREAANSVNGAPTAVRAGELIYDETENKLYAGQDDGTVTEISGGGGGGGNSVAYQADTAPENAAAGSTWFNTTNGKYFIRYNDTWVELGSSPGIAVSGVAAIAVVTQAEYDALDPPDPDTLYIVKPAT